MIYGLVLAATLAAPLDHGAGSVKLGWRAAASPVGGDVLNLLDGTILRPYANAWIVTLHRTGGRDEPQGMSSDRVTPIELAGRQLLSRTEGTASYAPGLTGPDSAADVTFNVFEPATLAPLIGEMRAADGKVERRVFSGLQITASIAGPGKPLQSRVRQLSRPVVDVSGGMAGLILACMPLRQGLRVTLPYDAGDGVGQVPIRVIRREAVTAGWLGQVQAWRVELGSRSTYWVRKTPPYVIRVEQRGSEGVTSWDMIGSASISGH